MRQAKGSLHFHSWCKLGGICCLMQHGCIRCLCLFQLKPRFRPLRLSAHRQPLLSMNLNHLIYFFLSFFHLGNKKCIFISFLPVEKTIFYLRNNCYVLSSRHPSCVCNKNGVEVDPFQFNHENQISFSRKKLV